MFFPVIPSGAASIMGEKNDAEVHKLTKTECPQEQNFPFLRSPAGFYILCPFITRKQCFTLITCECDANVDTGL
jgi:hypothetical protein